MQIDPYHNGTILPFKFRRQSNVMSFLCKVKKAYVIPTVACITFVVGSISIVLPFLPLGWALYGITALILMPYLPPLKRFYMWLAAKDRTGIATKIGLKIAVLYRWSEKTDLSREILGTVNEVEQNQKQSKGQKKSPEA